MAAVTRNVDELIRCVRNADAKGADVIVFPELALTAYTCADLFHQKTLQDAVERELDRFLRQTSAYPAISVVGLPLKVFGRLYNCAAVCKNEIILGVVPKTYLPSTNEFYETRWFSSGASVVENSVRILDREVPFGTDLIFRHKDCSAFAMAVEICEDLWSPVPPATRAALGGATILVNPSASNELVGKVTYRRELVKQQSARCLSSYVYCSNGSGESTTDVVFGGHCMIAENGRMLAETPRFSRKTEMVIQDVDVEFLAHERIHSITFCQAVENEICRRADTFREVNFAGPFRSEVKDFIRHVDAHPFVPADSNELNERCEEIFAIQSSGLATRLEHIGCKDVVIGLSGGLDSTLALLVVVEAFELIGLNKEGIHCITMPGFGTTSRTKSNAEFLCQKMALEVEVVDICDVCNLQLRDLCHSGEPNDVAYENVQARQRTQYLMNKANMIGGIVIGTGDLSELALGWCTYNGDHMSMYAVNTGVPKTLVKFLVQHVADNWTSADAAVILHDIVDTPISPELLPPDRAGKIAQKTEEVVGPYELHDFFLFQTVRCGFGPAKTLFLAKEAFRERYTNAQLEKWLRAFCRRFFSQQFKRSCLPDGPKVGAVALSPRGDWRMPSDACVDEWLRELDNETV